MKPEGSRAANHGNPTRRGRPGRGEPRQGSEGPNLPQPRGAATQGGSGPAPTAPTRRPPQALTATPEAESKARRKRLLTLSEPFGGCGGGGGHQQAEAEDGGCGGLSPHGVSGTLCTGPEARRGDRSSPSELFPFSFFFFFFSLGLRGRKDEDISSFLSKLFCKHRFLFSVQKSLIDF